MKTKIKLCGLSRPQDIASVNELMPEYIGFVFHKKSRRAVTRDQAAELKSLLRPEIKAVGVFVDAEVSQVAGLLKEGIIDLAQLHGHEDDGWIARFREKSEGKLIQAFRIASAEDVLAAEKSAADYILLDNGSGTGQAFDWSLIRGIRRPYFLAGGLSPDNVKEAVTLLRPYAVDVSSGIETGGFKDPVKMKQFILNARS